MNKKLLIAVTLLFSTVAYGQQPTPQPPVNQPQFYTLTVTPAELDIISEGLQTQPFKSVLPLMNKLREQVVGQQTPPKAPPSPEPKKE